MSDLKTFELLCALAAIGMLSACGPNLSDRERRVIAACGSLEARTPALIEAAYGGDLSAIDCLITRSDVYFFEIDYGVPGNGSESVAWRYIRWIESGEQPEDLMEIAAQSDRDYAIGASVLALIEYLRLRGVPRWGHLYYDDQGCVVRPPKMDAIWQAGMPGELGDLCADAVRDHPLH